MGRGDKKPGEVQPGLAQDVEVTGWGYAAWSRTKETRHRIGVIMSSSTFSNSLLAAREKIFNVTLNYPEAYLQALQALIGQQLETGASIQEARTAIQRLNNEWGITAQE